MKLVLKGHDERYVVEQGMLNLFPGERPVYEPIGPEDDTWARVSLREEADGCTVEVELSWRGTAATHRLDAPLTGDEFQREGLRRRAIGRKHAAGDIRAANDLARSVGFDCINMDLIAGLPQDSCEGFRRSLEGVLEMEPENVTIHTLALKKGSTLMEQGGSLPSGAEVAGMLDFSREVLIQRGYRPYYLYRQKYMSGALENVGWAKPGTENLYNIIMMEELQTVVSVGGGGVTKLVDHAAGRIVRLPNPKYPHDYLALREKVLAQKEELIRFYGPAVP